MESAGRPKGLIANRILPSSPTICWPLRQEIACGYRVLSPTNSWTCACMTTQITLQIIRQIMLGLVGYAERGVLSFQITILKVLAGHPDGSASLSAVTQAVSLLMSSGP